MAKIRLKLDNRKNRLKKDGTFPLVLQLSHKQRTERIGLDYFFTEDQWDSETCVPKKVANHKHIGAKVKSQLQKAELLLRSIQISIDELSMPELKAMIEAEILANDSTTRLRKEDFVSRKINKSSLTDYALQKIERFKLSDRHGSAEAIDIAMRSFKRFLNKQDILFTDVNVTALKNYQAYCTANGNKLNTIGAYLRQVRALFNEAINEGIIEDKLYPFKKFKLPKAPKTKNRALRMEEIDAIRKLDLKPKSAIWNARNYFLFMFNNMGINFIDLVKLKKSQFFETTYDENGMLLSGRIAYDRSKTRSEFSIKLTEESLKILNYYKLNEKNSQDFIFPYGFEDSEQGRKRYRQQRKRLNRKLRELAELAGIDKSITSYFARHSWATIAKRKNVPITLISEGLGHSEIKTTQIYLDSFDDDALDSANESIVVG
jgi:integrase/recombinase XerD